MTNPSQNPIPDVQTAEAFCNRMGEAIKGLKSVLEKETALIKKHNISRISDLQKDKAALSEAFQSDLMRLRNEAMSLGRLTPVPLAGLKRDLEELNSAVLDNQNVVEAGLAVSQSVVRKIADKVAEMNGGPTCYGPSAEPPSAAGRSPGAIAIDRKL